VTTLLEFLAVPQRDTKELLGQVQLAVTTEICTSAPLQLSRRTSRRDAIDKLGQLLASSWIGFNVSTALAES
jgi:hypothetical protein